MIEKPNIAEEMASSTIFGLSPRISETTLKQVDLRR